MSHKPFHQKVETPDKEAQAPDPPCQTIIVHGNCQAGAIANILKKTRVVRPLFRVIFFANLETPAKANAPLQPEELANCRIFLRQHLPTPFPYSDQLPSDCIKVHFPSLDFHLLWPFGCANAYNKPSPPQVPWGAFPYGDRIILECVDKGMKPDEILDYYLNGWQQYRPNLKRLIELEESRQAERDSHCEVKMGGWVMEHFRRERLHWTVNHPTTLALRELLQRLFHTLATMEPALERGDVDETLRVYFPAPRGPLGVAVTPIHPRVAEALGLQWYQRDALHPFLKRTYSYEEYFREMIGYCVSQRAAAMASVG